MKTNNLHPRLIALVGALSAMLLAGNALSSDSHDAPAAAPAPTAAAPAAPKAKPAVPAASGDDQMSKALFDKISKGSGDIVIRTGDLPAGAAPAEAKPADKPKVAKAAKPAEKEVHHDVHWSYIDGQIGRAHV